LRAATLDFGPVTLDLFLRAAPWTAAAGAMVMVMVVMMEKVPVLVLVLGLHRVVMAQFFEAAIVLGVMLLTERMDAMNQMQGVGGRGGPGHGQRDCGTQYISHGGSPDSFVKAVRHRGRSGVALFVESDEHMQEVQTSRLRPYDRYSFTGARERLRHGPRAGTVSGA
jgi:hypothetical protein